MDIQIEKKSGIKAKHYAIILGVIVLIVVYLVLSAHGFSTVRKDRNRLAIAKVSQGKFDNYITITGTVAPITTIFMDAYEGGRVSEKLIEEGATVQKGDVILKLENTSIYEQILASESNLALKQNDLRSTRMSFNSRLIEGRRSLATTSTDLTRFKRNFEQNQALYNDELISREDYLRSKEDYELAQKQYEIVKSQVENDEDLRSSSLKELEKDLFRMQKTLSMVYNRLEHLNVKAPTAGQIGFLDAEIGQNIDPGQRIGQINVLTNFKIEAEIDEHYIDRVKFDLAASLERNNSKFPLKVRKVFPEVREGKFKVDLTFNDKKPETIRAGQTYSINLKLGESSDAILIPRGGFYQDTGGQWIFVLSDEGKKATRRNIRIGMQNAKYYEVLEGLIPGEEVITSGYQGFEDSEEILLD